MSMLFAEVCECFFWNSAYSFFHAFFNSFPQIASFSLRRRLTGLALLKCGES